MPQLLEEKQIHIEWGDIDRLATKTRRSVAARSSGVHLSGVIKYVMTTAGLLTPEDATDLMPLRMCVGMAFEQWVVQLYPDLVWQPGEVSRDGIYGSPDGVSALRKGMVIHKGEGYLDSEVMLEEFKATWKSRLDKGDTRGVRPPAKEITQQKIWMMQLAGYCHMMGLTLARLHVLWINGDYRNSGPEYFTYMIQFTRSELERMWNNMILPNKGGAEAEVHG
jgi:hypothetical protein